MHPNIDLAIRRFNLSAPPARGEDKYEEKLTNWFLEGAFFRDFVFRNQPGKGGRGDLADGLVLFDRTALCVQSKAQDGDSDGKAWAAKNIRKAIAQVGYGERGAVCSRGGNAVEWGRGWVRAGGCGRVDGVARRR